MSRWTLNWIQITWKACILQISIKSRRHLNLVGGKPWDEGILCRLSDAVFQVTERPWIQSRWLACNTDLGTCILQTGKEAYDICSLVQAWMTQALCHAIMRPGIESGGSEKHEFCKRLWKQKSFYFSLKCEYIRGFFCTIVYTTGLIKLYWTQYWSRMIREACNMQRTWWA